MNMIKNLMAAFAKDEAGAVTVDWVVLTAAVAGMGLLVFPAVTGQITGGLAGII